MIPVAYLRSQVACELEETIKFGDLTKQKLSDKIREKIIANKIYYKLKFKHGEIQVYGPRFILINGVKYTSLNEAKRKLVSYIQ